MRAGMVAVAMDAAGSMIDGASANDRVVVADGEVAASDPGRLTETGKATLRVPLGRPLVAVARMVPPKRLCCGTKAEVVPVASCGPAVIAGPVSSPASRPANMSPPDEACPAVEGEAAAVRDWEI